MLDELKFVRGAIPNKSLIPALTHFAIDGGRVRGYNGIVALCSPIALDLSCKPKAEAMVRAIAHCDETATLTLTPTGRLSVKSGSFKALIDCVPDDQVTPHPEPDGDFFDLNGEALLEAFRAIKPFIGDDASRSWTNGILLRGQSAFATNNYCLVEFWIGSPFPHVVNIPEKCIEEMVRVGEPPIKMQVGVSSVTFHYPDGRWIRTQLLSNEWPDLARVLDRRPGEFAPEPIDPALFPALHKLKAFTDKYGRIYVANGMISTHLDHTEGSSVEAPSIAWDGVYGCEWLMLMEGIATYADFRGQHILFLGDRLRGAISRMRDPKEAPPQANA